ncbi:MAG: hypothetical protein NC548_42725 [Lachnospiraceae bacterium]|nr:hypothetical protein [Lachnospiraceae bacterium]
MDILATSLGVIKKASRIFITGEDVMQLFGCGKSKAYAVVREVNEYAKKQGKHPLPSGKANKYLFSDIFDIPIEEVDEVINRGQGGE